MGLILLASSTTCVKSGARFCHLVKNGSSAMTFRVHHSSRRQIPLWNLRPEVTTARISSIYSHFIQSHLLQHPYLNTVYTVPALTIINRHLHNSRHVYDKETVAKELLKPSSQVEVTVNDLKEKAKSASAANDMEVVLAKKTILQRVKEELLHYYHGFRLLFVDVRICSRYIHSLLNGESLSRRERRQLIRTTSDLFRLLPFSVFIIVPFMEFLLPVALKLFPGMLPSTFETANEKEANMKKTLKVKLEMAKFLQQTLDKMSVEAEGHVSDGARKFVACFEKIQKTGGSVSNKEILQFSKLFEDEVTLDSLSRQQLMALCRLLEMQPFGTNNFLRFQLRMKLRSLVADDKIIHLEGVETLVVSELQQACRARGMRAYGLSEDRLRSQLSQWLDLSLNEKVPPSLLLLSRTLLLPGSSAFEIETPADNLAATISALPEEVATRTKASIGEREGKISNTARLEEIRAEEKKIKEDRLELKEERLKKVSEPHEDTAPILVDHAPIIETVKLEEKMRVVKEIKQELTAEDLRDVEEALETLGAEKRNLALEKQELAELKEELQEYKEDVEEFKTARQKAGITGKEMHESKAAQRLFSHVNKMIGSMEPIMDALAKESAKQQDKKGWEGEHKEELVNLEELTRHMKYICSVTDSSKVEMIKNVLAKMDDDKDGAVKMEHVMKVIQLMLDEEGIEGTVSPQLFEDVIKMVAKEEQIESASEENKMAEETKLAQEFFAKWLPDHKIAESKVDSGKAVVRDQLDPPVPKSPTNEVQPRP